MYKINRIFVQLKQKIINDVRKTPKQHFKEVAKAQIY